MILNNRVGKKLSRFNNTMNLISGLVATRFSQVIVEIRILLEIKIKRKRKNSPISLLAGEENSDATQIEQIVLNMELRITFFQIIQFFLSIESSRVCWSSWTSCICKNRCTLIQCSVSQEVFGNFYRLTITNCDKNNLENKSIILFGKGNFSTGWFFIRKRLKIRKQVINGLYHQPSHRNYGNVIHKSVHKEKRAHKSKQTPLA